MTANCMIRLKNVWRGVNTYIFQLSSSVNKMEQNENTDDIKCFVFICGKG